MEGNRSPCPLICPVSAQIIWNQSPCPKQKAKVSSFHLLGFSFTRLKNFSHNHPSSKDHIPCPLPSLQTHYPVKKIEAKEGWDRQASFCPSEGESPIPAVPMLPDLFH
jgi:hypothetical protein